METIVSDSLGKTERIAAYWVKKIARARADLKERAKIAGLTGHLGSGKTAFVKAVGKALNIREMITSPTFVLMKNYEIQRAPDDIPFAKLIHIDAYRLENREELDALGFEELAAESRNLIMVEWPENVGLRETEFSWRCNLKFEIKDKIHSIAIS